MGRLLLACALGAAGCSSDPLGGRDPAPADLVFSFSAPDAGTGEGIHHCADDHFPNCNVFELGPGLGAPFPLPTDMPPDPNLIANGVVRDKNGYLTFDASPPHYETAWIANATDWSRGTVSRVHTGTARETARYFTVACKPCQIGCCSTDDLPRFTARLANQAPPDHQPVQLTDNLPSRTSIDFNGDLWIENRAPTGQASITKIANDSADCADRNQNGRIDTSSDGDGDGLIQTDCNGDGRPDDLASVKSKPCANGKPQEFFGLDDECLLFTTNIGAPATDGRALALGPGAQDFGPSDPWAGTSADATIYRVDGTTGMIKDRAILPIECRPDGLILESSTIAWTAPQGPGPLCWFAPKKPADHGPVRYPQTGPVDGRALSIDRDRNLWLADRTSSAAWRYTPDRSAGTAKLGAGLWTHVTVGGMGNGIAIAVDSRTVNSYLAWLALDTGWLVRLPASAIPLPQMADREVDASKEPALPLPDFSPIAVGGMRDGSLALVSRAPSGWLDVPVDAQGTMAPPGTRRLLKDNPASEPGSDAYTDFTYWPGGTNCFVPRFVYAYVVRGCDAGTTRWLSVEWDADVPLNTALTLMARSGATPQPDLTWGQFSPDFSLSPADLGDGQPLFPNSSPNANHLQFEFRLSTTDRNVAPHLKWLRVAWDCIE